MGGRGGGGVKIIETCGVVFCWRDRDRFNSRNATQLQTFSSSIVVGASVFDRTTRRVFVRSDPLCFKWVDIAHSPAAQVLPFMLNTCLVATNASGADDKSDKLHNIFSCGDVFGSSDAFWSVLIGFERQLLRLHFQNCFRNGEARRHH